MTKLLKSEESMTVNKHVAQYALVLPNGINAWTIYLQVELIAGICGTKDKDREDAHARIAQMIAKGRVDVQEYRALISVLPIISPATRKYKQEFDRRELPSIGDLVYVICTFR